jgi:hypothetical protein
MFSGLPDPDRSLFVRIRILSSKSKKSKKNLDFYNFLPLFGFLLLKTDVNVPSKAIFFVGILLAIDAKSRIRIQSVVSGNNLQIRILTKNHGFATLKVKLTANPLCFFHTTTN